MKKRTKVDSPGAVEHDYTYTRYKANGTLDFTETRQSVNFYKDCRLTGYDIPNFRSRLARGELLPYTPFRKILIEGHSHGSQSVWSPTLGSSYTTDGDYCRRSEWIVSSAALDTAIIEADLDPLYYVQQSAARVYSSGHDTMTFLAELHKVRGLFRDSAKNLLKLLRKEIAKGRKGKAFNVAHFLSDNWLQYRYGWRTLVFDMFDIYQAITTIMQEEEQRTRFSHHSGTTQEWDTDEIIFETGSTADFTFSLNTHYEVSCRGSVVADIMPPTFALNPITTGWELITLSFVVDWFYNIGQMLEALSFKFLASKHFAASGHYAHITRQLDCILVESKGNYDVDLVQTALCDAQMFIRSPATVPNSPQTKIRIDAFKVMDLVTIIYNLVHSRR